MLLPTELRPRRELVPIELRPTELPIELRPTELPIELRPIELPPELRPIELPAELPPEVLPELPLEAPRWASMSAASRALISSTRRVKESLL